jgi:MerR family transcriptional regulator, light-induced transcriptional regulator
LRLKIKRKTLATYSIRDLENISGIKAHTLRIWEQRYEILQPKRTDTNIRFYEEDDLRLLLSISMLNSNGYKISQIAKMSSQEIHDACGSLTIVSDEFSHQINALTLAMIELDEERFEKAIANSTLKYGFEDTMIRIIHPFFERVGLLWQTGSVRPAQEHFITSLIRQKLIVAIDAQDPVKGDDLPKYALYLPENELHELSLLFACYILRSRGNRVIYLGQNVPDDDLPSIYDTYKPDYFVTILTVVPQKETVQGYLTRLGKSFPRSRFLVSGMATESVKSTPDNVILLKKASELLQYAQRG